jgi:hypothetical protein
MMTLSFRLPRPEDFDPLEARLSAFCGILDLMPEITPFGALNALHSCGLSVTEIGALRFDALVDEAIAKRMVLT